VGEPEGDAFRVEEFVEKPTLRRAQEYLAAGGYYWNLAMFAWRASVFLAELERVAADYHAGLVEFRSGTRDYADLQNEAVDYAVLEKTDRLFLVPADFDWLDVGSWSELLEMLPTDENGNSIEGESAVIDTKGSLISAPGKLVAAIGVEDLIVVDTDQALLILPRSRSQDVKRIVEMLRRTGKTTYL
jgi:mannose-1-phosphate guanylyltransferase